MDTWNIYKDESHARDGRNVKYSNRLRRRVYEASPNLKYIYKPWKICDLFIL